MSASYSDFEIPNSPGQTPRFDLAGVTPFPSSELNDNQNEQDYFAVLAHQLTLGDFTLQTSLFAHYNRIHFTPDAEGDLIYEGAAGLIDNVLHSEGAQIDATYILDDHIPCEFGTLLALKDMIVTIPPMFFRLRPMGCRLAMFLSHINDEDSKNGCSSAFMPRMSGT